MILTTRKHNFKKKFFSLDRKSKYLDYDYDTQGH